jgi:hypothetical protein
MSSADIGDWVVQGTCPKRGIHFWPVKPEYFQENYEEVEGDGERV